MTTTQTTECQPWCNRHIEEYDDGEITQVCRASVTVRSMSVSLEDSPSWGPDHRPIVPPDMTDPTDLDVQGARDLSDALAIAASVIDGNHNAALLVDQVQR